MPSIPIRRALVSDVPPIMELIRQIVPLMRAAGNQQWDDTYPNAEVFLDDIALHQLWLAEAVDGHTPQLAGLAALTTDQSPEYAQVGWDLAEAALVVHRLAVSPAFRGQGVAKALMLHAEAVARARHLPSIRVDTNSENQQTQRLFPSLGYTFAGEITLDFRPGQRFLCYEKRLG
jgi:ribosomal protein S18 acetylase RimI-like enzyme